MSFSSNHKHKRLHSFTSEIEFLELQMLISHMQQQREIANIRFEMRTKQFLSQKEHKEHESARLEKKMQIINNTFEIDEQKFNIE